MADEQRGAPPAIVAVDDEPAVLAAVARDLRRGFGERYRIVRAGSGAEALDVAARAASPAASRSRCSSPTSACPGMAGTEYLVQARKLVPDAKRVLLTAYADTEAAIRRSTRSRSTTTCSSRGTRPRSSCSRSSRTC